MRIYDPRAGRFLSVDPISKQYPWLTPYQFASNRPIDGVDLDGLEFFKKDNTNYILDYKPVLNSPNVSTGFKNAATNVGNLLSNITVGPLAEAVKGINNYFAGGYKENTGSVVSDFIDVSNEQFRYTTQTPVKEQLRDLGNTASDLKNYELPAQLLIFYKLSTPKVPIASLESANIIGARQSLASDFYKKAGFTAEDAINHMEGIEFGKEVQTTTLLKGTVIQQWVGKRGIGNYFTTLENGAAKNLGLSDYDLRELKPFTLTKDIEVLKSTASDYKTNPGGGTQFFGPEIKKNIKEGK